MESIAPTTRRLRVYEPISLGERKWQRRVVYNAACREWLRPGKCSTFRPSPNCALTLEQEPKGENCVLARKRLLLAFGWLPFILFASLVSSQQQPQMSEMERGRAEDILQTVAGDVRKHYYDPKFHGVNWDAKVAEAKQKIHQETSFNMSMAHIAAALDVLNDSHTFFLPPQHSFRHDYGWQYQMVGSRCYVTRVRPQSDAEDKGVKPGDEVLAINGYEPSRDIVWKMEYVFTVLQPQSGLRLSLRDITGRQRQVDVMAKVQQRKKVTDLTVTGSDIWDLVREGEGEKHHLRARYMEQGDELMILKLPEFAFSESEVDTLIGKARKHKALILDLRENPGGSIETLKYFVGSMFENEVKICDRVGRKESKPIVVKPRHNAFTGKLVVLVDSRSASASEVFSRVVQIEKRGVVLGDQTSGSVMEAKHYSNHMGADTLILFGESITDADLIMADSKSLEHAGVMPNELILPTAKDLADGRDPVMTHAAEILGLKLTPEAAGKLFPYEWAKD